jgi:hypothetical protein
MQVVAQTVLGICTVGVFELDLVDLVPFTCVVGLEFGSGLLRQHRLRMLPI